MVTLNKIKQNLPKYIEDNAVLNSFLGAIADALDTAHTEMEGIKNSNTVASAQGSELDAIGTEHGVKRSYKDSDEIYRLRIFNSIRDAQQRGSHIGAERDIANTALATPLIYDIQHAIGINPIGTGYALGGKGKYWMHIWNNTPESQNDLFEKTDKYLPIHTQIGKNHISGQVKEIDIKSSAPNLLKGFEYSTEGVTPTNLSADYQSASIDLGASYASYVWFVDQLSYKRWNIDAVETISVRFSANNSTWSQWKSYENNQVISPDDLKRYIQIRLELKLNNTADQQFYILRKLLVKYLSTQQFLYGEYPLGISVQAEIADSTLA